MVFMSSKYLVVGVVSDDPFAIDVAHHFGQEKEISDLISLKNFANTEFCPRLITDENDLDNVGQAQNGKTVIIVSTECGIHTRNALAMRTCLLARAAKDNGAEKVVLVEPDLFYSAQDRGPRPEHGKVAFSRTPQDYKKFDGQGFSSLLYSQLLKTSGVDAVLTIHNHSISVQSLFKKNFDGNFFNLSPAKLYADYLMKQNIDGNIEGLVLCAPDKGATPFVTEVYQELDKKMEDLLIKPTLSLLQMSKVRSGERSVEITASADSPTQLEDIAGREVIVFDDMVRTGHTIMECCRQLKKAGAKRVTFVVTHFYSSAEVKENLNDPAIDEIITTNTLPGILNRDKQGRLRKKMLVLKIEKWIAAFLKHQFCGVNSESGFLCYAIDMSTKNPRWKHVWV
jgi:ribose-phosphate pyrophosphokinase